MPRRPMKGVTAAAWEDSLLSLEEYLEGEGWGR